MSKRRTFTPTFKAKAAIEALKEQKSLTDIAQELHVHPAQITNWKSHVLESLPMLFEDGRKKAKKPDIDVEMLYAQIGKLQTQLEFLKKKTGIDHE